MNKNNAHQTIDLNGYVYGVFDEAKILCDSGADYKFPHELFIFGYDKDKEEFHVGYFTFGEHYSYSTNVSLIYATSRS